MHPRYRQWLAQNEELVSLWHREENELRLKLNLEDSWVVNQIVDRKKKLAYIGGVDVSFYKDNPNKGWINLAVIEFPSLKLVLSISKELECKVPYIPGFLTFREGPPIIALMKQLKAETSQFFPDLLLVDGNGKLHPRDFGLGCYVGVALNIPCVGVAKSLHIYPEISKDGGFREQMKNLKRGGDAFPLCKKSNNQVIAMCLKSTDKATQPVYVSQGHNISLESAVWIVSRLCRYRVPEPIRLADLNSRRMLIKNTDEENRKSTLSKRTLMLQRSIRPSPAAGPPAAGPPAAGPPAAGPPAARPPAARPPAARPPYEPRNNNAVIYNNSQRSKGREFQAKVEPSLKYPSNNKNGYEKYDGWSLVSSLLGIFVKIQLHISYDFTSHN